VFSKEQRAGHWNVWQTSLHKPDFAAYARLCGAHGRQVTEAGLPDAALAEALAHGGRTLSEIRSDTELA
jgi:thiamine pyrophosphate-dependent acetolactate synthase large subunit-like protein